jgi:UrcA family protein
MTRLIAAAGVCLAAAATPLPATTANVYLRGSSVHVRFGDLDLGSPDGRARLQTRIHQGARLLCNESQDDDFPAYLRRSDCYQVMVASGLEQMNRIVRR